MRAASKSQEPATELATCLNQKQNHIIADFDWASESSQPVIFLKITTQDVDAARVVRPIKIIAYDLTGQAIGAKTTALSPSKRYTPVSLPLDWFLKHPKSIKVTLSSTSRNDCISIKRAN